MLKKILLFGLLLILAACQAPVNRNVYQATGPRVCFEYYDSFRCTTPTRVWNEVIYPKNDIQMQYGNPKYIEYQPESLSKAVYGTY